MQESHAYEELRHLIVGPEQEGLKQIQERLDDTDRRAEDVSSVVAEAIQMRRDQGDDQALSESFGAHDSRHACANPFAGTRTSSRMPCFQ